MSRELDSILGVDSNGFVLLSVNKLRELADPIKTDPWGVGISKHHILKAYDDRRFLSSPVSIDYRYTSIDYAFLRDLHAQRIAYFMEFSSIDPIDVDVGCNLVFSSFVWPITDGNHRFYSAILREDKTILSNVSGSVDLLCSLLP